MGMTIVSSVKAAEASMSDVHLAIQDQQQTVESSAAANERVIPLGAALENVLPREDTTIDAQPPRRLPTISIVLPAYNGAATLEECLRAIRSSVFTDFELIVVDDGSSDRSAEIASQFADVLIKHDANRGRHAARCTGFSAARGEFALNIDQDVVLPPHALGVIVSYFTTHPDVCAVTGKLASQHPKGGFYSAYKNLYMYHVFSGLPATVEFLYGSLFAIRRDAFHQYRLPGVDFAAHDTAWGLQIAASGGKIALLQELEVVHLKEYSFASLLRNDFAIPYHWVRLFVAFEKWRDLPSFLTRPTGFAHASQSQLATIVLAYVSLATMLLAAVTREPGVAIAALLMGATWVWLNWRLFRLIGSRQGATFGWWAACFTYLDNLVMGGGLAFGFATVLTSRSRPDRLPSER
jgi:glycosyltransferase involved in cell wall biosynthesis